MKYASQAIAAFTAASLLMTTSLQARSVMANVSAAVHRGAGDTGRAFKKGLKDGVTAIVKGVDDGGKAVNIATLQTGYAIEKGAHDVGRSGEKVRKFVAKHPWETVIAIALIAGGGYLVVYQGYTLAITVQGVKVVTITSGALSGILVGSGSAIVGSGVIALATMKSPIGSDSTVIGARPDQPSGSQDNTPPRTSAGRPTEVRPVITPPNTASVGTRAYNPEQSIMYAPRLSAYASEEAKLNFAEAVRVWAEKAEPIATFDPAKPITLVELKIIEAITSLQSIPETSGDELADLQRMARKNPLPALVKGQARNLAFRLVWRALTEQSAKDLFTLASRLRSGMTGVLIVSSWPTVTSEGNGHVRDRLTTTLQKQLNAYIDRRFPQSNKVTHLPVAVDPNAVKFPANTPVLQTGSSPAELQLFNTKRQMEMSRHLR